MSDLNGGGPGRRAPKHAFGLAENDGYLAAEALMASLIMAAALAFGLTAFLKADQISRMASELRRATALSQTLLASRSAKLGSTSGQTTAFTWRMDLEEVGEPGRVEICRRAVRLSSRAAAVRTYEIATLESCPPKAET